MSKHKAYTVDELKVLCEEQGWRVERTVGGWQCFPKNRNLPPITLQKACKAPVELANYRARLARSGLRLAGYEPEIEALHGPISIPSPQPEVKVVMGRPRKDPAPSETKPPDSESSFDQVVAKLKAKMDQAVLINKDILELVERLQEMYMELEVSSDKKLEQFEKFRDMMKMFNQ